MRWILSGVNGSLPKLIVMPNYFEFYNLPLSFKVDAAGLKRQYYQLSKQYHPDFYTLESAEKQAEILALSTLNNEAYQTLSDFDKRMKYLLQLKGLLAEEGQNQLPQDFLLEMMDLNENLLELEMDFDPNTHQQVLQQVQAQEDQLLDSIQSLIDHYDEAQTPVAELEKVKEYYLKKRYLLRIRENLNKFASL